MVKGGDFRYRNCATFPRMPPEYSFGGVADIGEVHRLSQRPAQRLLAAAGQTKPDRKGTRLGNRSTARPSPPQSPAAIPKSAAAFASGLSPLQILSFRFLLW